MTGPVGLHGGGEYLAGDEPYLRLLLRSAAAAAALRWERAAGGWGSSQERRIHVAVVPTAAARHRPEAAARHGIEAFRRVAAELGLAVVMEAIPIVDAASAADRVYVRCLEQADLVHLPGGDPDLIPAVLGRTAAWDGVLAAHARGAVVAGASAGAMALGPWTWTPAGWREGLGLVPGLAVVPHFESVPPDRWRTERASVARSELGELGLLGLDERTGILAVEPEPDGALAFVVAGPGAATWIAPGADAPVIARDGQRLVLQGAPAAD